MKKNLLSLIAIITIVTTIQAQIPTKGLVAWYPFTGNAIDSSGNGNNGTVNGATLTTDRFGNPNGAYLFNSSKASQITLNLSSVSNGLVDTFSILLWVKPTNSISIEPESEVCPNGVSVGLANTGQNWAIDPYQVNNPDIGAGGLSVGTNGFMTAKYGINILDVRQSYTGALNGFSCIVQTYRKDSTFLYLNGVMVSAKAVDCPSARIILPSSVRLGGSLYSPNFSGIIDEAIIWNRALTNQEIEAVYLNDAIANTIPTNGLVAWYPFTGNAIDSSGNGNNGTVNKTASLSTDRFGNANSAYSFTNANGGISVPSFKALDSNYTISYWANYSSNVVNTSICELSHDWQNNGFFSLFRDTSNILTYATPGTNGTSNNISIQSPNSLGLNKWYNIIAIRNGSKLNLFVNGKLQIDGSNTVFGNIAAKTLFIGGDPNEVKQDPNAAFNGKLDDIRIYNRALDSTEVQALYHEGGYDSIPTSGLIAWYPFNGNTKDSSGNNYNGVANQIVYTVDRFGNPNTAININGNINSYVDVTLPDTSKLTNKQKSFSFWINLPQTYSTGNYYNHIITTSTPTGTGTFPYIQVYGAYPTYVSSGYVNKLGFAGLAPISNVTFNNSSWTYVTLVCDGINNTVAEYVNGKYVSTENTPLVNYTNWTGLRFGQNYGNLSQCSFSGMIDDIRIYNRSLDSTEILALYHENGYGNTLPLKLSDLKATYNNGKVFLDWSTATELNTSHFIVQSSTDGISFTDIGNVKAVGKMANSYQFVDDKVITGTNYYRLESVDMDGATTYSKVCSVQYANDVNRIKVYPNPVRSTLTISGEHIAMVQIFDNMGRVVNTQSLHDATNPLLSVSNLATGVYHVRIQTTDNKTSTIGFVKQ